MAPPPPRGVRAACAPPRGATRTRPAARRRALLPPAVGAAGAAALSLGGTRRERSSGRAALPAAWRGRRRMLRSARLRQQEGCKVMNRKDKRARKQAAPYWGWAAMAASSASTHPASPAAVCRSLGNGLPDARRRTQCARDMTADGRSGRRRRHAASSANVGGGASGAAEAAEGGRKEHTRARCSWEALPTAARAALAAFTKRESAWSSATKTRGSMPASTRCEATTALDTRFWASADWPDAAADKTAAVAASSEARLVARPRSGLRNARRSAATSAEAQLLRRENEREEESSAPRRASVSGDALRRGEFVCPRKTHTQRRTRPSVLCGSAIRERADEGASAAN